MRYRPEETTVNAVGPKMGLVRDGAVKGFNKSTGKVKVVLILGQSDTFDKEIECDLPVAWMGQNGEFSGGYPSQGSAVRCMMGQGGEWTIIGYSLADGILNGGTSASVSSYDRSLLSGLQEGRYLTQVENNIRVLLDPDTGIDIGSPGEKVKADPGLGILSNNFRNNMVFSEATMGLSGPLYRDRASNSNRDTTGSSLSSHVYQTSLTRIGLDPYGEAGENFFRNPVYAENRSRIYEFINSFGFTNDSNEVTLYENQRLPSLESDFDRRDSRADTLSLSQDAPNYLIEKIEGTVADVYGNLIDINRSVLPMGLVESLRFKDNPGPDQQAEVFQNLREQNRKTIAVHYELNAQKDGDIDVFNKDDYGRQRSRFFMDIDKEGQIKLNVPASSETGNVALLTRYENYSEIYGTENDEQKSSLARNNTNQDIFLDEHGVGYVSLKGGTEELESYASPTDWNTGNQIKLGTAFHDIGSTLQSTFNPTDDDGNPADPIKEFNNHQSVINTFAKVDPVVSDSVIVSGDDANAGGRSLTMSLDGSANISVGANTVDRQSIWLDTAGGNVVTLGRDLNNISLAANCDGDVLIEMGGTAVSGDSRFDSANNASREAILEIRMIAAGRIAVWRMSPTGIYVHHPGDIDIVAEGNMRLKSLASMIIDGETVQILESDGQLITRKPNRTLG